MGMLMLEACRG